MGATTAADFRLEAPKTPRVRVRRGGWSWGPVEGAQKVSLSLGAGIQSSCLKHMAEHGLIPGQKPDVCFYAETNDELPATEAQVDYLGSPNVGTIPVVLGNPDPRLDWIIVGGESGRDARPMHPDWARAIRDQCAAAGTPLFFKQWGSWSPCQANDGEWPVDAPGFIRLTAQGTRTDSGWPMQRVGKKIAGSLLDGVCHHAMPEARV